MEQVTPLAWSLLASGAGYKQANLMTEATIMLRWGADHLAACWNPQVLVRASCISRLRRGARSGTDMGLIVMILPSFQPAASGLQASKCYHLGVK